MTETIFFLPDADALSVLEITRAEYVARLIEAIPDDWSDVSGVLQPPDDEIRAVAGAGYAFHRFDPGVRVVARQAPGGEITRPDLKGLLVDNRLPAFVSFDDTGLGARWQFLAARDLAVGFVRRGFTGQLTFNNGVNRKYQQDRPAEAELHLRPWSLVLKAPGPWHPLPPAVVLRWSPNYGGAPGQVESIARVCRLACEERQSP